MSESPDDGRRLLARGFEVELADGAVHSFRFSNAQIVRLEDDYDGLQGFTEFMHRRSLRAIAYVIHLTLGVPIEAAIDLVPRGRRLHQCITAIGDALAEYLGEDEVTVRILQNHEIQGDRYRAGAEVTVSLERAKHLIEARVAERVPGNPKAAPANGSPGAASSTSRSASGTSTPSASGA